MTGSDRHQENPYRVLMNKVTLKFPPVLEREYYGHLTSQLRLSMVVCNTLCIISLCFFVYLFGAVMKYTEPMIYVPLVLVILLAATGLVLSNTLIKPPFGEYVLSAGALLIQACWITSAVYLPDPWLKMSFAFFMLVGLFDFLMLPIRYVLRFFTGAAFAVFCAAVYYRYNAYPTIIGSVGLLNSYTLGIIIFGALAGRQAEISSRMDFLMRHELDQEKIKSEKLLYNAIPPRIAERLKLSGEEIADFLPDVTVMFVDISGFTAFVKSTSAAQTVKMLNHLFSAFDHNISEHQCEKIKTIGDAYLIVAGLEDSDRDHQIRMLKLLTDMRATLAVFNEEHGTKFLLRAGIHTGPAVAGVIGQTKFSFDLWGETVNFASRLESSAGPGETLTSDSFAAAVAGTYKARETRNLKLKGIGEVQASVLELLPAKAAA